MADLRTEFKVNVEKKQQIIKKKNIQLKDLLEVKETLIEEKESLNKDNDKLKEELQAKRVRESRTRTQLARRAVTTNRGSSGNAVASYYGSELYGNRTADGSLYTASHWGVAHKTLPFGTQVSITYNGKTVTAPVTDRGPFISGRDFDLSNAVARSIGFSGVQRIQVSY